MIGLAVPTSFIACPLTSLRTLQLYDGLFDFPHPSTPATIPIRLRLPQLDLAFDLRTFIEQDNFGRAYLLSLTASELSTFCEASACRAELARGHLFLRTDRPTTLDLSTCYVRRIETESGVVLVVIAFNETQPARYKAELVAVLKEQQSPAATV